ncbi:MAG: hypothetical protein HQ536_03825 [Parcubacteria group bacterium]|nr:hypothetical protein [Parcubacteria group bacterium]
MEIPEHILLVKEELLETIKREWSINKDINKNHLRISIDFAGGDILLEEGWFIRVDLYRYIDSDQETEINRIVDTKFNTLPVITIRSNMHDFPKFPSLA